MRPGQRALLPALVGVLVGLGLAGCTSAGTEGQGVTPKPTTQASPSEPAPPSEESTEEPSEPAAASVTIPECAGLMTEEQVAERLFPDFEPWAGPGAKSEQVARESWLGPVAGDAFDKALQSRSCYWGRPNSGLTTSAIVVQLPTDVRVNFVKELRKSLYEESSSQGITMFTHTIDDGVWLQTNWYGFVGDVWVYSLNYGPTVAIETAFENLRAAKPEWAAQTR